MKDPWLAEHHKKAETDLIQKEQFKSQQKQLKKSNTAYLNDHFPQDDETALVAGTANMKVE